MFKLISEKTHDTMKVPPVNWFDCEEEDRIVGLLIAEASDDDGDLDDDYHHDKW